MARFIPDKAGPQSRVEQGAHPWPHFGKRGGFPGFLGLVALHLHGRIESGFIRQHSFLDGDILDDIHGKAIGIVELEDKLPCHHLFPHLPQPLHLLMKHGQPVVQSLQEAHLLVVHHFGQKLPRPMEMGIGLPHLSDDGLGDPGQKGLFQSQGAAETDGPPHDAPEHIAPPLVGGQHPVGHQKGGGPAVVGDDP